MQTADQRFKMALHAYELFGIPQSLPAGEGETGGGGEQVVSLADFCDVCRKYTVCSIQG